MDEIVTSVRPARHSDVDQIVDVHDAAWRGAYRGLIPGVELERLIARRGPNWWRKAIARGSGLSVLEFDGVVVGYVSFGRNRAPKFPYAGEIFELYVAPDHQGLGFGRHLFLAARRKLALHGCGSTVVWALSDNAGAVAFYRSMGGAVVSEGRETFGREVRERLAFGFVAP